MHPLKLVTRNLSFVCGNGTSRANISLQKLQKLGKVYACNAVYRDFNPDYLVSVDTKMILEIVKSGYQKTNNVWTNKNKVYESIEGLNFFNPSKGWSSGPTALHLASSHSPDHIYILGFDYEGLNGKINNVFANTNNYKKSTDNATYYGNWLRQTKITIDSNPNIKYTRVINNDSSLIPNELKSIKNLQHITKENFVKLVT